MKSKIRALVGLAIAGLSGLAYGGAVIGATEITQFMNNLELLDVNMNTSESVIQQANAYYLQEQQYETQLKQLSNLAGAKETLRDAKDLAQKFKKVGDEAKDLYGDLKNAKTSAENIFRDMSLKGLTEKEYIEAIRKNTGRARDTVKTLLTEYNNNMKEIEESYEKVLSAADKIPGTEGIHQSTQLLNSQVNTLLTQNAQFMRTAMAQLKLSAEEQSSKVAREELEADNLEKFRTNYEDSYARTIKAFKKSTPANK